MENASSAEMSAASSTTKKMKKRFIKLFSSSHKATPAPMVSHSEADSTSALEEASSKQSHKMQETTELSESDSSDSSGSATTSNSSDQDGSSSEDESDTESDDDESSESTSDNDENDDDDDDNERDRDPSWVSWFLSLPGNHLYLRVSEEFIEDEFNLTELSSKVPNYRQALDMIMDLEPEDDSDTQLSSKEIKCAAKILYSLVHARYLLTRPGMCQMADRYEKGYFGTCPRYMCLRTRVIPVGLSDSPNQARVQVYCPSCNDVYQLPSVFHRVDGAAFGTSFPHIFFKTFPSLVELDKLPPPRIFEPRIFGFKLYRKKRISQEISRKLTSTSTEETLVTVPLAQSQSQTQTQTQTQTQAQPQPQAQPQSQAQAQAQAQAQTIASTSASASASTVASPSQETVDNGLSVDGSGTSSRKSTQRSSRRQRTPYGESMSWLRQKPNYNRIKIHDML